MTNKTKFLNTLFNGDCLELLKKMPNDSVDLVISSPPYNIGKSYESRSGLDVYLEFQTQVLEECHRVLKDTGSIFWQTGVYVESDSGHIPLDVKFFEVLHSMGMSLRNRMIWLRPHGLHGKTRFSGRYETMLWFTKRAKGYKFFLDPVKVPQKYQNKKSWKGKNKGELTCDPIGKNPGDIWAFRNVKHNHEEQTNHPCQFPEDMIQRVILSTTAVGDVVFDPFMGTGTVPTVAKEFGRKYIGAELDSDYHATAELRVSGEPNSEGIFPNLKTLRRYADENGIADVSGLRFMVQKGKVATPSSKSKIFSEQHHLNEIESRTETESASPAFRRFPEMELESISNIKN